MLTPAFFKQPGAALPDLSDDQARYVVAGNGVFLERKSSIFDSSVRTTGLEHGLEDHQQYCRLRCGKLPRVMHRAMLGFFKCAHEAHGGEAALVLLYHPQRRSFRWHCPEQTVDLYQTRSGWTAGDTIEFKNPLAVRPGYLHLGDAHLHARSPLPSAIDVRDDQDGLHIIVGTIRETPSYHVGFVMDGARFEFAPEAVFQDVHCRPFDRPPTRWLKQIRLRRIYFTGQPNAFSWQ